MTTETPVDPNLTFNNLGIAPKLLEILSTHKFIHPTPIQQQSIPVAIEGKDLMGIAQTGTGKTLAFGVPMIQRLAQSKGTMKGLVILPTRELAMQVDATLKKIGSTLGLKTAILIGGEAMGKQLRALRVNPHIIIATPGRLIDHMERNTVNLSAVGVLILDEADRMLDMGFSPQINRILAKVPKSRQTMLFSATMPDEIVKIANSYMTLPLRVEVAPAGTSVHSVTQEVFFVDRQDKTQLLRSMLYDYKGSVLVFTRTKHGARKITQAVKNMGHTAAEIHSNRSLNQRIDALEGFKIGRYRVLVATDIAARGIDVTGIELVINFDLPATAEDYVHRIGRTGRAGLTGHAISFATLDQRSDVRSIERLIRKPLQVSQSKMDPSQRIPEPPREQRQQRPFDRRPSHKPRFASSKPHGKPHKGRGQSFEQRHRRPARSSAFNEPSSGYFLQRAPNRSSDE